MQYEKLYDTLKARLAKGWNTWNNRSVLSHVLLPEGLAFNLCIREYASNGYLKEALLGRSDQPEGGQRMDSSAERVSLGDHAFDASYTELRIEWHGIAARVESAAVGRKLCVLVTPLANQTRPATLVIESGMLWNRPGSLGKEGEVIVALFEDGSRVAARATAPLIIETGVAAQTPYLAMLLDGPIGFVVGEPMSLIEIGDVISRARASHEQSLRHYGEHSELYRAMQSTLAWDMIYEPKHDRVITPVSRVWNLQWGGYTVYCWDMYLAAYMAAFDNKDLAYSNIIEITQEMILGSFVPGCSAENGFKTLDRSQPPLGSFVLREIYRKYRESWLIEMLFDNLYAWNEWFARERGVGDGLLGWGSKRYDPVLGNYWEKAGVGETYGAAMESGLDNSPMYDEIPVDPESGIMALADVGLTSLHILDCQALGELATVIGKGEEEALLAARATRSLNALRGLWSEEAGIFLNRRTDLGENSRRLSPTLFYPLLTGVVPPRDAARMITEHLLNPRKFWGEWVIPSISRDDSAYPEQDYWRGRVWAPMNFLVYLSLRTCGAREAGKALAEKSARLLLKEWTDRRHVHENYNAETGEGCDVPNSDQYYHWGALLSLIALMETGFMEGPDSPL
jgi:hypothetical protein